jgi:hypothetical protein
MELKPTNKPYFRFERRDTGENIFVNYSAGIMLSFYDSNYGQWNLETDVYRTALQTNGYWLWGNTFLTEQCSALPNEEYRLRVNCANEPAVEYPNANCCYNQWLLPKDYWQNVCCPNFETAKQDYWDSLLRMNSRLG